MRRPVVSLVLGACAFGTAYAAQRLIAPYAGLSLTLFTGVLGASLLGFALGMALGAGGAAGPGAPAGRGDARAVRALLGAAVVTLLVALVRRPLLVALWHADLRVTVAVAAAAFAGLPCVGLGFAFAVGAGESDGAAALRRAAWLLAGAALGGPLFGYLLVPRLGLTVALATLAILEAMVALVLSARRFTPVTAAGVLGVVIASLALAARPVPPPRFAPRMRELRRGRELEYRVFDRDGARYLLADGTIHAVTDLLSGDCVQRGPAALELLRLMRPGRDSMLVVGLRGGALPLQFARSGWHVNVVEPDRDAVEASRAVAYKPGEIRLAVADPRRFLGSDAHRYTVIVVDAFADSYVPYPLCTRELVDLLPSHLTDDGLVVFAIESQGWDDPLVGAIGSTLRTRFADVRALPTSEPPNAVGTILLLASPSPLAFTDDQLPDPTTFFQNPFALWVVQQQTHAWLNQYAPKPRGAAGLTDDRSMADVWSDRVNRGARAELHEFFGPDGGSW